MADDLTPNNQQPNAPAQQNVPPAPVQPQTAAPQGAPVEQVGQAVNQTAQSVGQAANQVGQSFDQAGQAMGQVGGGLQQGVDQLKQMNVGQMFSAAANQPKVTNEEKLWSLASYIPLAGVLALLFRGDSKFVRLHGRQGLLLFAIFFFCIFIYLIPFLGPFLGGLIQFVIFVLGIFSMYQALIGNWWKIPMLGDIAEQIPVDLFTQVTKEVITGQVAPQPPLEEQPPEQTVAPEQSQPAPQAPESQQNPPAGQS